MVDKYIEDMLLIISKLSGRSDLDKLKISIVGKSYNTTNLNSLFDGSVEFVILARNYTLKDLNLDVEIITIYNVVYKVFTNCDTKDRYTTWFLSKFNLGAFLNTTAVDFIAMHITLIILRNLLCSRYNQNKNDLDEDVDTVTEIIKDYSNTIIVHKLVNMVVEEVERFYKLIYIYTTVSEVYSFNCYYVQTIVFKILKLVEIKDKNKSIVKTTVIKKVTNNRNKVLKTAVLEVLIKNVRSPWLEFNILLSGQRVIKHNNQILLVSVFIFISENPIRNIKAKENTIITDDFVNSLNNLSSTRFYINNGLLEYTKKQCIKILENLIIEEEDIIKRYKEINLEDINKLTVYKRGLADKHLIANLKTKYKKTIEYLKSNNYPKKFIKQETQVFDKKLNRLINGINLDKDYLLKESEKVDIKIKNKLLLLEKSYRLGDVVSELCTKIGVIERSSLADFEKAHSVFKPSGCAGVDEVGVCNNMVGWVADQNTDTGDGGFTISKIKKKYKLSIDDENSRIEDLDFELSIEKEISKRLCEKRVADIAKIQKHFSQVALVNKFIDYYQFINQNGLTFVHFFTYACFRGRIYYNSVVSPQAHRLFRFIYDFGELACVDDTPIIPEYLDSSLRSTLIKLNIKNLNLVNVLFSIGVLFKGEEMGAGGEIYFKDIFFLGVEKYVKYRCSGGVVWAKELELNTLLELNYYINIIENVNNNKPRKFYIIKDTTASFAQHIGVICGYKQDKLPLLNLDNDSYMYDTYAVIINNLKCLLSDKKSYTNRQYLKYFENVQPLIRYLDRSLLKGIIMTVNYGIGLVQGRRDFKALLESKTDCYFQAEGSELKIKKKILGIFPIIYYFLKRGSIEKEFYNYSVNDAIGGLRRLGGLDPIGNIVAPDVGLDVGDLKMFILYYELKQRQIDIKIAAGESGLDFDMRFTMGNRDTKYTKTNCKSVDIKKTLTACFVNTIHMVDALYLRKVVKLLKEKYSICIFTMHDGYAIEFTQVNTLLLIASSEIPLNLDIGILPTDNINIKKNKLYSIFV